MGRPRSVTSEYQVLIFGLLIGLCAHSKDASLCGTNHLPPEVLSRIFAFLQDRSCFSPTSYKSRAFHRWLVVTRVCHHWRDAALSSPALWNTLLIRRPCPQAVLRHRGFAGALPLDIFFDAVTLNTEEEDGVLGELIKDVERFREVSLRFHNGQETIFGFLQKPAPRLRSLTVLLKCDLEESEDIELPRRTLGDRYLTTIPILFNGDTPTLEKVHFESIFFANPGASLFRNLKELTLLNHNLGFQRFELADFLALLRESPLLERLVLRRAGLMDHGPPSANYAEAAKYERSLSLPNLRYMEVGDFDCTFYPFVFLKSIVFPLTMTRCIWDIGVRECFTSTLRQWIFPHDEELKFILERALRLVFVARWHIESKPIPGSVLAGWKDFTLHYYAFHPFSPPSEIPGTPCHSEQVRELTWVPQDNWELLENSLLRTLPELAVLRLSGFALESLDELCMALSQYKEGVGQFELAPKLQELHLYYDGLFCMPLEDLNGDLFQSVFFLMGIRRDYQIPLRKVVVGGFPLNLVEELKARSSVIEVDNDYVIWSPLREIWDCQGEQ